jgi:hypothetical protein
LAVNIVSCWTSADGLQRERGAWGLLGASSHANADGRPAPHGRPRPNPAIAGVGGAGIFAVGFHNPVTLVPWARSLISKERYDWVVVLVGINDLLRVGKPADEVRAPARRRGGVGLG